MRIRGLCKLLDGRDWLWGKLSLILVGKNRLSKPLIQFAAAGWSCVPSLWCGLRPLAYWVWWALTIGPASSVKTNSAKRPLSQPLVSACLYPGLQWLSPSTLSSLSLYRLLSTPLDGTGSADRHALIIHLVSNKLGGLWKCLLKQGFPWGWAAGLWLVGSAVVDQSWLSWSEIQWDLSLPVTRLWVAQQLFYTILMDWGKMIVAFDLMRAFLVNSTQPSWPRLAPQGSLMFRNWMTPVLQCLYQAPLSYSVIWKPFLFPSQLKADSLLPSEVPLHHSPSFTLFLHACPALVSPTMPHLSPNIWVFLFLSSPEVYPA